ncbi:MAG TPA: amidase family protein, partial [Chitinophagaceae bacterium]|nr:amidase family protein [Chitinophagaceae bacterium]
MINRRDFIKKGSAAGIGVAAAGLVSCQSPSVDATGSKKQGFDDNVVDDFELDELTVDQLQQKMQNGNYTSKSITEMYLKRIEAIDKNGPSLNSVIEVNPDAISIAENMDNERKNGKIRGPLHGIPVLIK